MPILLFADYNSGTPAWFSIPCFCALIIGLSIIMTWLRLASNSVWPCAILHASHNVFIQVFFTPLTGARGQITRYSESRHENKTASIPHCLLGVDQIGRFVRGACRPGHGKGSVD
jgi:hypothetical protein